MVVIFLCKGDDFIEEKEIVGNKFNHLKVLKRDFTKNKEHIYYICECDCGRIKSIRKDSITKGISHTCGDKDCMFHINIENHNCKIFNKYDLSGEYGIGYTSKGEEFYFDLEDYDLIKNYTWYVGDKGYIKAENEDITLHRVVMRAKEGDVIDHIFHKKFDNRKSQLRFVTHSQNQMNRDIGKNNTSGHRGISWHKKYQKWIAQIGVMGKLKYLGLFSDIEDAIKARKEAEEKYFGEYNLKKVT